MHAFYSLNSKKLFVGLFVMAQSLSALAAKPPLNTAASFDISADGAGMTFFELMSGEAGIKASLDADYGENVEVIDVKSFNKRASNFKHIAQLEKKLGAGKGGLEKIVAELEGQSIPMSDMYGKVMSAMKKNGMGGANASRVAGAIVPIIGITSGKGVMVQIDAENYVYNYGYAVGSGGSDLEADETNRKTGRSYGASIERNAYDPTDNDYLRELGAYVADASEEELENFYTTIFEILLKNDPSRVTQLESAGQTVVADFLAVYMAELDRHLMTGLKKYEWENALTEITMLAAFAAAEDGVTLDPRGGASNDNDRQWVSSSELKESDRLLGFFGVGTDGSGLDGRNKARRHALSKKIVSEQRQLHEELIEQIESDIGVSDSRDVDIYDEIMNVVNNFKTQDRLRKNADKLIKNIVKFVLFTSTQAAEMNILDQ